MVHPPLSLTDVKRRPRYVATRDRERKKGIHSPAPRYHQHMEMLSDVLPLADCVAQSHEFEAAATFIGFETRVLVCLPPTAFATRVALLSCPPFRYLADVGKRRPWHHTWTTWLTRPGQPLLEYPKNNPLHHRQSTPAIPVVAALPQIPQVDALEMLPDPVQHDDTPPASIT